MEARTKLVAAALLATALTAPAAAQTADAAMSAAIDTMCDYCADFTDSATAGAVRTAYLPGIGYAAATAPRADGEASRLQKVARTHLFKQTQQQR